MPIPTNPKGPGEKIQKTTHGQDILDLIGWDPRDAASKTVEEFLARCKKIRTKLHPDMLLRQPISDCKWTKEGSVVLGNIVDFIEEGSSTQVPAYEDSQNRTHEASWSYAKASKMMQIMRFNWILSCHPRNSTWVSTWNPDGKNDTEVSQPIPSYTSDPPSAQEADHDDDLPDLEEMINRSNRKASRKRKKPDTQTGPGQRSSKRAHGASNNNHNEDQDNSDLEEIHLPTPMNEPAMITQDEKYIPASEQTKELAKLTKSSGPTGPRMVIGRTLLSNWEGLVGDYLVVVDATERGYLKSNLIANKSTEHKGSPYRSRVPPIVEFHFEDALKGGAIDLWGQFQYAWKKQKSLSASQIYCFVQAYFLTQPIS